MDFYDLIVILRKEGLSWSEIQEEFSRDLFTAQSTEDDEDED